MEQSDITSFGGSGELSLPGLDSIHDSGSARGFSGGKKEHVRRAEACRTFDAFYRYSSGFSMVSTLKN